MPAPEPVVGVIETAIYADDLNAAKAFYQNIMCLAFMSEEPGRHVFFRVGNSVLLVFDPVTTLRGEILPPHGAKGPGHFAMGIRAEALDAWRAWLQENSVAIEQEVTWPRGSRSLYFRDPAGNAVELITPGLWGLRSGW
jgi:catechol-2,3-dioxygenase